MNENVNNGFLVDALVTAATISKDYIDESLKTSKDYIDKKDEYLLAAANNYTDLTAAKLNLLTEQ
jgi:hypothetical protein